MTFYKIDPEIAGDFGPMTVLDTSVHPPAVSRLDYRFQDYWNGDGLLATFPAYIVRDIVAEQLTTSTLTGFELADVDITLTPEAEELITDLPAWRWLQVTGTPGQHDFGLTPTAELVVSEPAMTILRTGGIDHAEIQEETF